MLLAAIPGAIGLILRKLFWPRMFGGCGKGVVFATRVIVRHPNRIYLGDRVVISEGCILDARNPKKKKGIVIGDDVIFSNNVMISCKNGTVEIGSRTGLSANTIIHSTQGNPVRLGTDNIIGPRCYIVGGGNYNIDQLDVPMWKQGIKFDGGVALEDNIWLGAGVTVLGGVTMKKGSIAAAGAVVNKSIPEYSVCGGIPAKVLAKRD